MIEEHDELTWGEGNISKEGFEAVTQLYCRLLEDIAEIEAKIDEMKDVKLMKVTLGDFIDFIQWEGYLDHLYDLKEKCEGYMSAFSNMVKGETGQVEKFKGIFH